LLLITLATAKGGNPALYPPRGDAVAIFLVDNGTHSDLAIPRAAIVAHGGAIAAATAMTTNSPWVLVGWGDARFYEATSPWQDRIGDGLRALLGGRPTAVHLQGLAERPDQAWGSDGVHRILVSQAGLSAMLRRIDRAFALNTGGSPIPIPTQRPPGEGFFASGEDFSLVHLCNHWTDQVLNAAGLPVTPVLDTVPAGLIADLQLRAGLS
ncbi:MAG TPA: DUF2459 domain-containing protein, partial [Caulobacteraceae bacterium]|nr:DUF2459 domain-containing protein [Caulobacteraceae bacterium]